MGSLGGHYAPPFFVDLNIGMPTNVTNIPDNKNFLSPVGFKFTLNRSPNLSYNIQRLSFPGINVNFSTMATPFVPIPINSRLDYNPLTFTFKVDEDLNNYLEIYNWALEIAAPDSFSQYKKDSTKVDANLIIMTSSMRPNISIDFYDLFPISLSDMEFDTSNQDINYIDASVSFKYLRYTIKTLV
jgi:hypothetical protein